MLTRPVAAGGPPPQVWIRALDGLGDRLDERSRARGSHRRSRSAAPRRRRGPAPALRLAILVTDPAGEILYWNAQAEAALERLPAGRSIQRVDRVFTVETLGRLRQGGRWANVSPIGAPDVSWSVRARYLIDSGRSLFLFLESEAGR